MGNNSQDEFSNLGIKKSLEVKTLVVIDPEENSGKGYRTQLLNEAISSAYRRRASGIHLIVSSKAEETKKFLLNKDFKVVHSFEMQDEGGELLYHAIEKADNQKRKTHLPSKVQENERNDREKKRKVSPNFQGDKLPSQHHDLTLKGQYLSQIKNGSKTVEGRIFSGQFTRYREGDTIRFFNRNDSVTCRIKAVNSFNTFKEMMQHCGVHACLPDANSLEDGVAAYHKIPNFSDRERRSGVVSFEIERQPDYRVY